MSKDKSVNKKAKTQFVFNIATKEGFLIEAPEGWEIDGEPVFFEGFIVLPVEKTKDQ